jgi:hypothetical protein
MSEPAFRRVVGSAESHAAESLVSERVTVD